MSIANSRILKAAEKLINASMKHQFLAFSRIQFPGSLDTNALPFPEEYISIYNLPVYLELSDEQRWRLGLLETVNFFSLNIHGEQALISELTKKLYRDRWVGESALVSEYMQHFIHEENAHTHMLAQYCLGYNGRIMPDRSLSFDVPKLSWLANELLFYTRVFVLESFLDFLNLNATKDKNLEATTRNVHRFHHLDEARHIAFDKAVIREITDELRYREMSDEIEAVGGLVKKYTDYVFSMLYNPWIYKEVGIRNALSVVQQASLGQERKTIKEKWETSQTSFLRKVGIYCD